MPTLAIIILIVALAVLAYSYLKIGSIKQLETKCKQLQEEVKECSVLASEKSSLQKELEYLEKEKQSKKDELKSFNETLEVNSAQFQKLSSDAASSYFTTLEQAYSAKEKEFDNKVAILEVAMADEQKALEDIKKNRQAAQEAIRQEKLVQEKKDFYRVQLSQGERHDYFKLMDISDQLNQPRILYMLIWQNFFQKKFNTLCANVLGAEKDKVCGIYKITNIDTNMSYVGQSVDIARRWKDHAKCGCGVDTPSNNALYSTMQTDGLWKFTFEFLEECPKEKLNEREKYFIETFQTDKYGFNSTAGNKG